MSVITIREQQQIATGFAASISFGDGEYDITITDPFTPQEERELEWYFEEWLVCPIVDTVKAERAKNSVKTYGEICDVDIVVDGLGGADKAHAALSEFMGHG
jgi:hypothetical protein